MGDLAATLQLVVPWLADALVILGVFVMTIGIYGIVSLPDTYTRLHAASKVVFLGVVSLLLASLVTGDPEFAFRVVLIGVFLILTTAGLCSRHRTSGFPER